MSFVEHMKRSLRCSQRRVLATSSRHGTLRTFLLAVIVLALLSRWQLKPAELATTKAIGGSAANTIHYHWRPDQFTDVVKDCIFDDDCRILYHHVYKTGGTTMERILFKMLPPTISGEGNFTAKELTNTDPHRLPQFAKHPHAYCEQAKFSSYQATGKKFKEIIETCRRISTKRYVTLTAYREPIARTLSLIHQQCNKNFEKRREELRNACTRCRYNDGEETDEQSIKDNKVWDGFTEMTNDAYTELLDFNMHLKEELNRNKASPSVQVLMLDMADIDNFFQHLDDVLVSSGEKWSGKNLRVPREQGTFNKEKLGVCSFGMKSQMIKSLKPSLEAYRSLTLSS